jgi:hypothetical protein
MVLLKMKESAETYLGTTVNNHVVRNSSIIIIIKNKKGLTLLFCLLSKVLTII